MTEPPPVTKIDDLPNEMLENVIPDSKPQTISTLKLINKKFYQLLSQDRYYKYYVNCPEKYYLCEMKNEKNSGKELIDKIKTGTIGKWKGYLTLQKLHLENLRCGRIKSSQVVPLQTPLFHESQYDQRTIIERKVWQERIDEDGEHWLLGLTLEGHVQLINVTSEPKTFVAKEVVIETFEHVILMPGQVICSFKRGLGLFFVIFNIVNSGGEISLQRHFDFEMTYVQAIGTGSTSIPLNGCWTVATGKCESSHKRRNVIVNVNFDTYGFDGLIHLRDLSTGKVLDDVHLWDYECLKRFGVPASELKKGDVDILENQPGCDEDLPYALVRMFFGDLDFTVVVVFNVDSMSVTSFVELPTEDAQCCLTRNVAYIYSDDSSHYYRYVHSIPLKKPGDVEELKAPNLLHKYSIVEFYAARFNYQMSSFHGRFFLFHPCHLNNEVGILTVDDSEILDVRVKLDNVDCHKATYDIIGNDVLVVHTKDTNCPLKMFKVAIKKEGTIAEELIDWQQTFLDYMPLSRRPRLVSRSQDNMNKMIFQDEDYRRDDHLVILNF